MKLSKSMVYRFNFFGVTFVDGTLFLIQLLMFSVIYSRIDSIGGWGRDQVLFFIGTFSIINALNMTLFFFGVQSLPQKIRDGQMDLYITKPVNTLFYISFESINIGSIPLVLASIGLVAYAANLMGTEITVFKIAGYVFLVIIMTILWYDMEVIWRTIPFFVIKATAIDHLEGSILNICMKIPGVLFKGAFKLLFYVMLPYGIMATIPTQFFAGTLSIWGFLYGVGIVIVFSVFTLWFWRFGLRNYKSASS